MAERLVLCGGSTGHAVRPEKVLRLDLHGPDRNIHLRLHDISRRMLQSVPDLLTDLLELAAYVYGADSATSRGGAALQGMGSAWRRRFRFVLPVRKPEVWSSEPVREALSETLGFLTDDRFAFEFEAHRQPPPAQGYIDLEKQAMGAFQPDEIILFSGGLDSLAGIAEVVLGRKKKAALVSHHSSNKLLARQKQLFKALKKHAPRRLWHFPVLLQKQEGLTDEYTLRSRSFVFASLAVVIARMLGNRRILMCENGIVSLNLPIARQLVGTRASRTTHPKVLASFGLLFRKLFGEQLSVENPLLWSTKTEVAEAIHDHDLTDLIPATISCSHVHQMNETKPHCGECSQCIERRFGILGAGLEAHDPEEKYQLRLLLDDWKPGEPRTLAESYVRSAIEARNASEQSLYAKFAGELSRALQGLPGDRAGNARALVNLHKRHGEVIFSVLRRAVRVHAGALVDGSLPPHCLLRMAVSSDRQLYDAAGEVPVAATDEQAPEKRQQGLEEGSAGPEIRIAIDTTKRAVLVQGGLELQGEAVFSLLELLLKTFEEDLGDRRAPENYRYTRARMLAEKLGVQEETFRRRVLRIRKMLSGWFAHDYPLPQDALIENSRWNGYRINPAVRLLDISEFPAAGEMSRHPGRRVTTRSG